MAWYGRIAYAKALAEMQRLRAVMIADPERLGTLILCEHPPTITCGKHSESGNVLLSKDELERRGVARVAVERGGDVTYHGPGQLMVYPVVRVGIRVSAYLQDLANVLAAVATKSGVDGAEWQAAEPGLWLGGRKLAACGLNLKRGVSIHGYALNVSTPAVAWQSIVPCGLAGPGPVSLAEMLPEERVPSVEKVAEWALPVLVDALIGYGLDPDACADLP